MHHSGLIKLYPADNVIELLVISWPPVFKNNFQRRSPAFSRLKSLHQQLPHTLSALICQYSSAAAGKKLLRHVHLYLPNKVEC